MNIEDVSIDEIAYALSHICRFNGHTSVPYSVAEHCWRVSNLLPPELALWGLLHDASESLIADVSKPLKETPEMAPYRDAEEHLQNTIYRAFGLTGDFPDAVHRADMILLATELRDLMPYHPDVVLPAVPLPDKIVPYSYAEARAIFLQRFASLRSR